MFNKVIKKNGKCIIGNIEVTKEAVFNVKFENDDNIYSMSVDIEDNITGYGHGAGDAYYGQNKVKAIIYKDKKTIGAIGKNIKIIETIFNKGN